jgi:hypothetical protein
MNPVLDPKAVATSNPAVDIQKLEQVERIRQSLEKAGVFKKASYGIAPPLGGPGKPVAPNTVRRMSS